MKYLGLILLLVCTLVHADIYMKKDEYGNITYSDKPLPNGVKIDVPEVINTTPAATSGTVTTTSETTTTTLPTPTVTVEGEVVQPAAEVTAPLAKKPYTTFAIASPKDQETIQNQPVIPVDIVIDPPLQKNDRILLLLDGKPAGEPEASTRLELANVERGSHQVGAVLVDSNQKIIKQSNTVTIFVHRASIQSPPAAQFQRPPVNPTPTPAEILRRLVSTFIPLAGMF